MPVTAIYHASTGVIRRVTTLDPAEVGVADDELYVVLPKAVEGIDLSARLKVDAQGNVAPASLAEIDSAGIDPTIEARKERDRRQRFREAKAAVLALQPDSDNVRAMIATIIDYVRKLD